MDSTYLEALAVAETQGRCLARHQARAIGLSRSRIDWLVASGRWRSLFDGVYFVESAGIGPWGSLPFGTRLFAITLMHGPRAVACLGAAARLHGLPVPERAGSRIDICVPPGLERHQQPGVDLHVRRLRDVDIVEIEPRGSGVRQLPVRTTSLLQTVCDLLRTWHAWDAVSALDAALAGGGLPDDWQDALRAVTHRRRGSVQARRLMLLGDARSESPLETRIRLIATDAGFPPDDLQHPIRDEHGHLLGDADLAWFKPDGRTLVAEADGRVWHEAPEALFRDRRRANDFSGTGSIDIVRFTWADTRTPQYVAGVLRRRLS